MFARIEDFLALLEPPRKRRDSSGSYICKCPAHDDSTESLHVKLGRNKYGKDIILLKCFAGCEKESIVAVLGLTMRDLTLQPGDAPPWDESKVHQAVPTYERKKAPSPPPEKKEKPDHGMRTLDRAYPYTDEQGKLLFEAVRYRYDDGTKTFRQRRPDPDHPGQWIWNLENTRLTLYRLPAVIKAIQENQTIWIAEGEKDADNLARLGLCGTTSPMGAGKWKKGSYTQSLAGAQCYILPDNDDPGWAHAREVAQALEETAQNARILDLKRIWPDIPAKGDVSDLIAHLGDDAARDALIKLAGDHSVQYADMEELVSRVKGYTVADGCPAQYAADGAKRVLSNFLALPVSITTLDDGVTAQKIMEIRGWTSSGRELPRAFVPVTQFPGMTWVSEKWDIAANISPGNTVKDKLRYVIAEAGRMVVERKTQYTHTGWRQMGGQWAYLHGGGAVGAENVNTLLEGALGRFRLEGDGQGARAGYRQSRNILEVIKEKVSIPLLAAVYLAPLRHFLQLSGIPPNFALFLVGKGGGRKSTAAALALSHYGNFTSQTPTASFHDTANSVRKKAFQLKDMPLLVDDYHPTQSPQERRKMEAMAQDLARAFGDNADRGRMNADRTLQTAQPPRCVAIMTGEDLPQIGESGLARFFIVRMTGADVPISPALTAAQQAAAQGALQSAMIGYIKWLQKQADDLKENLKSEWLKLRLQAQQRLIQGSHARSAEAAAFLMLGWEMMLMYGYGLEEISREQLPGEIERGWQSLLDSGQRQTREALEDTPENAFLDCVRELLATKQAWVKGIGLGADPESKGGGPGMIGYVDDQYYMLLPDLTYRMVADVYTRQGTQFPLSKRGLLRALVEGGSATPEAGGGATRARRIDGRNIRLLWIRRHHIDGGPPPAEQQEFVFTDVTGDDPDNPF